jgi:hypothetical protein
MASGMEGEVQAYLRRLGGRLRLRPDDSGRRDLIDEARDHILSHAEELVADGVSPRVAVATAVRAFGPEERVAPALRGELVRRHLIRLSTALVILGVALGTGWQWLLAEAPPMPWPEHTRPVVLGLLDTGSDYTAAGAVLLASVGLALLVLPGRVPAMHRWRARCQRWSARASAASAVLGAAACVQLIGYLAVRAALAPASLAWPSVAIAGVLTLTGAAAVIAPLWRIATGR